MNKYIKRMIYPLYYYILLFLFKQYKNIINNNIKIKYINNPN